MCLRRYVHIITYVRVSRVASSNFLNAIFLERSDVKCVLLPLLSRFRTLTSRLEHIPDTDEASFSQFFFSDEDMFTSS